jgi:hypothetical protein
MAFPEDSHVDNDGFSGPLELRERMRRLDKPILEGESRIVSIAERVNTFING